MKTIKTKTTKTTCANVDSERVDARSASDEFHFFEIVGDKLVNTVLTKSLLKRHGDKGILFRNVLSIPEICGENLYYSLDEDERVAIGECLLKLIESGRIQINPPKEDQD
jgi:hypothetical protein